MIELSSGAVWSWNSFWGFWLLNHVLSVSWSAQILFLHDSVFVGHVFLEIYPFLLGFPMCWELLTVASYYPLCLCDICVISPPSFMLFISLFEFCYFHSDFSVFAARASSLIFLLSLANGFSVYAFKTKQQKTTLSCIGLFYCLFVLFFFNLLHLFPVGVCFFLLLI